TVEPGRTIADVAKASGITLHRGFWTWANCRGFGLCGSCKVWAKPLAPGALSEKGLLERIKPNVRGQIRLGCQARILGDCESTTKPGSFDVVKTTDWQEDPRPWKWKERLKAADEEEPAPKAAPNAAPGAPAAPNAAPGAPASPTESPASKS